MGQFSENFGEAKGSLLKLSIRSNSLPRTIRLAFRSFDVRFFPTPCYYHSSLYLSERGRDMRSVLSFICGTTRRRQGSPPLVPIFYHDQSCFGADDLEAPGLSLMAFLAV